MKRSTLIIILFTAAPALLFAQQRDSIRNKIAPSLKTEKPLSGIRIMVKDNAAFKAWIALNLPGLHLKEQLPSVYQLPVVTNEDIKKLEKSPFVIFIDRAYRIPKEERVLGEFDFTLNKISTVHSKYVTLTGEGLVVSIKEKPFDLQDIDLRNRILLNDQFDEAFTQHATVMATIAAGAGNSEPSARGVAPAARVTTSDFLQLSPDNGNDLTTLGVTVQNHSYGVGVENYYGIESSEYDKHCQDFPTLVHVFSSGNDGDTADASGVYAGITGFANLTGQFKTSKNTFSVGSSDKFGNVVARSSRGPSQDGRVKPELLAYGDAGSSDAAAVVSGITLLIQQYYQDIQGNLPPSSLVKAILVNSADDSGRPEVDFETGFGNADALGSVKAMEQNNFFLGNASQNDDVIHTISIPSGVYQLKATLVWNDPEALPNAVQTLMNDLDFELVHVSSGDRWKPWVLSHYPLLDSLILNAKRKVDHVNTVEQITLKSPVPGDYELHVKGYAVQQEPQAYSVVFEYESGFEWTNPLAGDSFVANKNTTVRWRWSKLLASGKLEYKYVDELNWIEIGDGIDMSQQYFQWATPDTTALVQLRITAGIEVFESVIFPISNIDRLRVGYNCENEVMLLWSKVEGADEYTIYTLGEKYLEPLLTTVDTFAIFQKIGLASNYFTVAPLLNSYEGVREFTIDYNLQGTGCYFITFLARQYVVTQEANFDVSLGTTYNLKSATLERFNDGVYEPIETIAPLTTSNFVLHDYAPLPGIRPYRVKLTTDDLVSIFSEEEKIFYVREDDLYIYPNPIFKDQALNIVISDQEDVSIQLIDMNGKLIAETEDFGEIKTVDTSRIESGLYSLWIQRQDGRISVRKLIVRK